ncbi:NeuD/PglB/VioB family sugar acetyltransferase [Nubsella zeaxanthinifaciens]|uniref:NeuD/PglB/VioB family sugar acetyltransferase n=1 Tax=Nubsella zeaxanthinifaciens TaxID=392412 RepID=UPI003D03428F
MKKIVIIGAGSVGGHIASNLSLYGIEGRLIGFLDDDTAKQGSEFCGFPILGGVSWLLDKTDLAVVIGIAFPRIKALILNKLAANPTFEFPTLVAGNAWLSNGTTLGKGVVIYPGTCINYGAQIGDFVVMNMNCSVGHHCLIDSFSSLAPNVSLGGHTKVGFSVELGIGCSTLQGVTIGNKTIIGAQCLVHQNLPENIVAVGVPATIKRYLTS